MPNFRPYRATHEGRIEDGRRLEKLISAANFMMDVLDNIQFRDASGLRLHEQHPAYCRLQEVLDEVTK